MVKVGVVGCGYWGPKLARNFHELPSSHLTWLCDLRQHRLDHLKELYPQVQTTRDCRQVWDSDVDAVAIATPVSSHHRLSLEALRRGKHVLVEKPLAASAVQAEEMVSAAAARGLTLMVGHTFEYNPAVEAMRTIIGEGVLGEIYYARGTRVNLGLLQPDINVVWDLAPHDISILMFILGADPFAVSARGEAYIQRAKGIHEVAYVTLYFPQRVMADLRLSWLDPVKMRRITVVGSKRMLVYDDIAEDKVLIYDKGVEVPPYSDTPEEFHASYRHGGGISHPIDWVEPLRRECAHFIDCITTGGCPRSDGHVGLKVVKVLEAAQRSLLNGGTSEPVTC